MASDLKVGTLWTPPTFTDDGSHNNQANYLAANGTYGINGIAAEIVAAQTYARNAHKGVANVLDYGAVGDGVTDDRAAIQAAIDNDGTRNTIYFPHTGSAKYYKVAGSLVMNRRQHWFGDGPTWAGGSMIVGTSSSPTIHMKHAGYLSDLCLKNSSGTGPTIRMVGSEFNVTDGNQISDSAFYNLWFTYGAPMVLIDGIQGLSIVNCVFDASHTRIMDATNANNFWLVGNRFFAGSSGGVRFVGGLRGLVTGNLFDYCASASHVINTPTYANLDHSAAALYLDAATTGFAVTGNTFSKNFIGLGGNGAYGNTVSGNQFIGGIDDAVRLNACSRMTLDGNTFEPFTDEWTSGRAAVRSLGTCANLLVANSVIKGNANRAYGVLFSATTTKSIIDNLTCDTVATPATAADPSNSVGTVVS